MTSTNTPNHHTSNNNTHQLMHDNSAAYTLTIDQNQYENTTQEITPANRHDLHQRGSLGIGRSISAATLSSFQNNTHFQVVKRQMNEMRANTLYLKKEKLKAEHHKNMADIRIKQLEEIVQRFAYEQQNQIKRDHESNLLLTQQKQQQLNNEVEQQRTGRITQDSPSQNNIIVTNEHRHQSSSVAYQERSVHRQISNNNRANPPTYRQQNQNYQHSLDEEIQPEQHQRNCTDYSQNTLARDRESYPNQLPSDQDNNQETLHTDCKAEINILQQNLQHLRESTIVYLLHLSTASTKEETIKLIKEMANMHEADIGKLNKKYKSQIKLKYKRALNEHQSKISELERENMDLNRELCRAASKISWNHVEQQSQVTNLVNAVNQTNQLNNLNNISNQSQPVMQQQPQVVAPVDQINLTQHQLIVDKVCEERNLISLQNKQYKSILEEQQLIIQELQKQIIQQQSPSTTGRSFKQGCYNQTQNSVPMPPPMIQQPNQMLHLSGSINQTKSPLVDITAEINDFNSNSLNAQQFNYPYVPYQRQSLKSNDIAFLNAYQPDQNENDFQKQQESIASAQQVIIMGNNKPPKMSKQLQKEMDRHRKHKNSKSPTDSRKGIFVSGSAKTKTRMRSQGQREVNDAIYQSVLQGKQQMLH